LPVDAATLARLGVVFVLSVLGTAYLLRALQSDREAIAKRVDALVSRRGRSHVVEQEGEPPVAAGEKSEKGRVWDAADRRLSRIEAAVGLAQRLKRAGLPLRASEFVAIVGCCALGLAAIAWIATGLAAAAVGGLLAGATLPVAYLRSREGRRLRSFDNQLPDALTIMSNSLRSGYTVVQAMDVVGREMPPPIAQEFDQVIREVRVNIALEDALTNLLARVPSPDLDLVVTAILIQREVGGNLAGVLDRITSTIRERVRIMGEIRTLTAQGRISGWIIGLLPVALGVILYLADREYMGPLVHHPLGWVLLAIAFAMQVVGVLIIRKLVNVEV